MKTTNTEKYLNKFGKYIVQQSKSKLSKAKKNLSKELYNSIKFEIVITKKGFSVDFYMNTYGTFVDKGVSGKRNIQQFRDFEGVTKNTPYKYTNKMPPIANLEKWVKARGIRGRKALKKYRKEKDKNKKIKGAGQFIKDKSLAFLIARSIFFNGIQGIGFFQRPLELGMQRFGPDILTAVKEDFIDMIDNQFKVSIN